VNIPSNILTLLAGIAITLISLWLGQNNHLLPLAASKNAPGMDGLFNTMLTIAIALFLVVQGLIIIAAFRFKQKPGDNSDGPPIEGNIPLEILWTAIPAVLVLGISIYSFQVYSDIGGLDPMGHGAHMVQPTAQLAMAGDLGHDMVMAQAPEAAGQKGASAGIGASPNALGKPADVTVNVLGMQYAWIFTYPDTGVVTGELHVPIGQDVQLNLNAQDVLHAFWVPEFRLKQDAIPGRPTELRFTPTEPGTYPIICAELCGSYHGAMRSQVIVETPEDYSAWRQEQVAQMTAQVPGIGEAEQTVAMVPPAVMMPVANVRSLPESEFLQPYAQSLAMAVRPEAIAHLHHH
jgi:cytochrome c oxidase subunit II